jgi:hypothetical protein
MTLVILPEYAIEALAEGKTVEIRSCRFGEEGYNGVVSIRPGEPESFERVEVRES